MNSVSAKLLFLTLLLLISSKTVFAFDPNATGSAIVSATILSTDFGPPILISPSDNSATSNSREQLVWRRPNVLPNNPLHHYDLFLDGQLFAASVSDSITSQSYYFYNIRRDGDYFYLELNTDLAQGYHTWSVTAYDSYGIHESSETRTFYVDSITPFIKLEKVNRQVLNWDTQVPSSIPGINQRDLSTNTANPLLSGKVEPYANMQIALLCPQNIQTCNNQSWQGNYSTGEWQHRFYGLIRGLVYTVHITAIDAAGNSIIFPEFYLAFGIVPPFATITPTASLTPTLTPTLSPTVEVSLTPSITQTPTIEITPSPYIREILVSPTPPVNATLVTPRAPITASVWFMVLLVFGLPLHLVMTIYGAKIRVLLIPKFLLILLFPYLGNKEYQTVPFTTVDLFDPEKLDRSWQTKISDINGFYHLSSPLIEKIFVKISATGRIWKNIIIDGKILPITCLLPLLEDSRMSSDRLQKLSMRLRLLPLIIASLTSLIALITLPDYFFVIYLTLSVLFAFSEYLYPKLSK